MVDSLNTVSACSQVAMSGSMSTSMIAPGAGTVQFADGDLCCPTGVQTSNRRDGIGCRVFPPALPVFRKWRPEFPVAGDLGDSFHLHAKQYTHWIQYLLDLDLTCATTAFAVTGVHGGQSCAF